MQLVVPDGGIAPGTVFGIGHESLPMSNQWELLSGSFVLSTLGDNMHLFCLPKGEGNYEDPLFLSSLYFNVTGLTTEEIEDAYNTGTMSKPPPSPSTYSVLLPNYQTNYYDGIREGTKEQILADYVNPNEWFGGDGDSILSGEDLVSISLKHEVTVLPASPSSGARMHYFYSLSLSFIFSGILLFTDL